MIRKTTLAMIIALAATFNIQADLNFSIRYQNKNIYYPGDQIKLKITISNPDVPGGQEASFHLAENPVESFGFDVRSLSGVPSPLAEGFTSALHNPGAFRIMHLARGQELSITVNLNDWTELSEPGQYRINAFFYPEGRKRNAGALPANAALDLTVMPETDMRWQDKLDEDLRQALIRHDLSPRQVVESTLTERAGNRYNRALLYLDLDSLVLTDASRLPSDTLERKLLSGSWELLAGFEHPSREYQFISSQVFSNEATVKMRVKYSPYGEVFSRDLRFYLHKDKGYWCIRRVESSAAGAVNPDTDTSVPMTPPEVVTEMLQAVVRGDWDIVLRYYDVSSTVRSLPEYADRWKDMSASEHRAALDLYKSKLVSGTLEDGKLPFSGIEKWKISRVNYSDMEGSVVVENTKTYSTADGNMPQKSNYIFRLSRNGINKDNWQVMRYDVNIIR
ncbi:MAG: hypothetical protein CSA76_00985 [Spirochaetales bacterium]|nr:MAG: hypothetical protein CSA76_00985 [Spirochaetales bacterium]